MATSFIERMHYLLIVSISALSALTTNVVVNLLHVQRSWSFIIIVVITGTTFSAFIDIFLSFLKIFLKNQNLLGIYTKHTHTCDTIFTFDGDYKLSALHIAYICRFAIIFVIKYFHFAGLIWTSVV